MSLKLNKNKNHLFSRTKINKIPNLKWNKIKYQSYFPPGRIGHSTHIINNEIYIIGGIENGKRCNNMITYDFINNKWKDVVIRGKNIPTTYNHASCNYKNIIYVFGGEINKENSSGIENDIINLLHSDLKYKTFCVDTLSYFDTYRREWKTPELLLNPIPCKSATLCVLGKEENEVLLTFGGCASGSLCPIGDLNLIPLKSLQQKNAMWTQLNPSGKKPSARFGHTCVTCNNSKMIIYGGYDGKKLLSDIFIYDLFDNSWSEPSIYGLNPTPVYYHTSVNFPNSSSKIQPIITFGGIKPNGMHLTYSNDLSVFYYICDENELKCDIINIYKDKPDPRAYHSFVMCPYSVFDHNCVNSLSVIISFLNHYKYI